MQQRLVLQLYWSRLMHAPETALSASVLHLTILATIVTEGVLAVNAGAREAVLFTGESHSRLCNACNNELG